MLRIIPKIIPLLVMLVILSGCGLALEQVKKSDSELAGYLGQQEMTSDCRAGIAQCDADISPDPVNMNNIRAVTKFADEDSPVYQACYNGTAWLYYKGKKYEGAFRALLKKAAELGILP
jgi:hypothetical protein